MQLANERRNQISNESVNRTSKGDSNMKFKRKLENKLNGCFKAVDLFVKLERGFAKTDRQFERQKKITFCEKLRKCRLEMGYGKSNGIIAANLKYIMKK